MAVGLQSTFANAAIPERLKWVRGTVAAVTETGMTALLRSKAILFVIDDTTEVMLVTSGGVARATKAIPATAYLKVGDAVEVHFRDSRPIGSARYIWVGIPLDAKSISRGSADSAAGSIADLKPASWWNSARMTLTSGKDRRSFQIASDTQLMDRRATLARAVTRLPPAVDALEPNDRVVVVYRRHHATLRARLIRVLPRT